MAREKKPPVNGFKKGQKKPEDHDPLGCRLLS